MKSTYGLIRIYKINFKKILSYNFFNRGYSKSKPTTKKNFPNYKHLKASKFFSEMSGSKTEGRTPLLTLSVPLCINPQ